MSIEWEKADLANRHSGTGPSLIISAKQAMIDDQTLLHINLLVYLDLPVVDPRPALEAMVFKLREELGLE